MEGGEPQTSNYSPHSVTLPRQHRTTTRPFFVNDRTSDLGLFDKYINKTLNHISSLEPNQSIDFEDLVARFTIDTASEFLFGHSLDTLSYRADGFDEFMDAFVKIQEIALERGTRGGLWPLFEPFGDRSKKYGDVLKEWVTPLVERALEHKRRMSEKGLPIQEDQSTLLEYLAISFDGNLPPHCNAVSLILRRCHRHSGSADQLDAGGERHGSFFSFAVAGKTLRGVMRRRWPF